MNRDTNMDKNDGELGYSSTFSEIQDKDKDIDISYPQKMVHIMIQILVHPYELLSCSPQFSHGSAIYNLFQHLRLKN